MEAIGKVIDEFFDETGIKNESEKILIEIAEKELTDKRAEIETIKKMIKYVSRETGYCAVGKIYIKSLLAYTQNPEYAKLIYEEFSKENSKEGS